MSPLLASVWLAADGQRSAVALLDEVHGVDPAADVAIVWQALDALADAGLLAQRVAPPGGVFDPRLVIRRPLHSPRAGAPTRPRREGREDRALQIQRERLGSQRHAEEQRKERQRVEAVRQGPQAMRRERSAKVVERQRLARSEAALLLEAGTRL